MQSMVWPLLTRCHLMRITTAWNCCSLGSCSLNWAIQAMVSPDLYSPEHPKHDCVVVTLAPDMLLQIGEFYEAVGQDALMLVEHCGLNPMPPKGGMPVAGCPRSNLRPVLARLVDKGFTVVSGTGTAWLSLDTQPLSCAT